MTKQKSTRKALLASAISLIICVTMLLGTTFAWFTDSVESGRNTIVAGNLDVELEYSTDGENWTVVDENTSIFSEDSLWEPGHAEGVALRVSNKGTLALKYNLYADVWKESGSTNVYGEEFKLSDYLTVHGISMDTGAIGDALMGYYLGSRTNALALPDGYALGEEFTRDEFLAAGASKYFILAIEMPSYVGNEANYDKTYSAPKIDFGINLVATQVTSESDSFGTDYDKNAEYPKLADRWGGSAADYNVVFANYDETDMFTIGSAEELAALATAVNVGGLGFEGKTVVLTTDVNMEGQMFTPIGGIHLNAAFQGTFDGQGHTIKNLTESGWDLGFAYGQQCGMGLFGWVYDATIKNITLDNSSTVMEAVVMGNVAGYAGGNCTFENITVKNSEIANYNWDTGGIVGQAYGGDQVYKNITVDESNTISGLWGTWDVSAGGIIGRTHNVNVVLENCDVAAKMDVFNDVVAAYQWYAYRYSGMLVGYTKTTETDENGRTVATAPHVTCIDCTVTYGDWANYTYCQFDNVYPQFVREQGGLETEPYYSGRHWTAAVDINGNKVVDSNHAHDTDEEHSVLLPFDQLFGGGQGVYGTATHDGVTVIYNN